MGLVPFPNLGTEAAGVVLRVGSAVTRIKPGDRVVCMVLNGFRDKTHEWEGCCVKIPDELKYESFEVSEDLGCMQVLRLT